MFFGSIKLVIVDFYYVMKMNIIIKFLNILNIQFYYDEVFHGFVNSY